MVAGTKINDLKDNKNLREGLKTETDFKLQLPHHLQPSLFCTQQNSLEKVVIDAGERFICAQVYYVLRVQYLPSEEAVPDEGGFLHQMTKEDLWEDFTHGLSKFNSQQIILVKNETVEMPPQ